MVATCIFYQEFQVDEPFFLHLFLDGCLLTFFGVFLITASPEALQGCLNAITGQQSDHPYTSSAAIDNQCSSRSGGEGGVGNSTADSACVSVSVAGADSEEGDSDAKRIRPAERNG